jgi:HPt (histidine-containing phosphotransfer) domain-containing protein
MSSSANLAKPIYSTLGTDPDLREIVQMFVEEMPDRMSSLLDRLNASDWEGLRRVAHQLKGAAGSYGFEPITRLAARLEDAVRESQPEEALRRMVEELVDLCHRAKAGPFA